MAGIDEHFGGRVGEILLLLCNLAWVFREVGGYYEFLSRWTDWDSHKRSAGCLVMVFRATFEKEGREGLCVL